MTKGRILALLVAGGLLLGALIYGSFNITQSECSLCVEFNGRRQCRTGLGATEDEAKQAAQRAACAVMASGMAASIACDNRTPYNVQCSGK